jgi:hypothetical protein
MLRFNVVFLVSLLLLSALASAEDARLNMSLVGYGKTYQEVHIALKNTGNLTIKDITLYVNGGAYKTLQITLGPGKTFENVLFLNEGQYMLEARSPEGTYDLLNVTSSMGEVSQPNASQPTPKPSEGGAAPADIILQNILWIVLLAAVIVFSVSVWLLSKRRPARK